MARPRVFISSTFFDLRQVRADLERFVKELGYDTVRNETGAIPYGREERLEEYCYKEISEIDILVGIVGGRFGSEAERGNYSITQVEIKTAIEQNKQVYIFIEKSVLAEYQTYLINKENETTKYKFVEDKRIYKFIEEIYALPKNNIVHPFETALDITNFLREQWAGLFRELLIQQTRKAQYESVSSKVDELTEVATTLQTYLENVLQSVSKEKSKTTNLIIHEKKRLEQALLKQRLKDLRYISHLENNHMLDIDTIISSLQKTSTIEELKTDLQGKTKQPTGKDWSYSCLLNPSSFEDLNTARKILRLNEYLLSEEEQKRMETRYKFRPPIKKPKKP
jgi:hypothetical protein